MYVALIAQDRPGFLETRLANRAAHLQYVAEMGNVFLAGPLLDDDGQAQGSLIILDVADMAEARAWATADPYAKAGLFQNVELKAWNKVIG